ncbi:hypothetical protein L3V59_39400 [Burkholderia aenigmatica]|uniref:hypothetical protein n=1 Tax=Burkholderia cepacia complex TaxID=87882 RepID=UPI00158BC1BE|nr:MULTISPECIES: hypothetical protein [Burkholderia cepacia complex]UKD16753.1 hypothetical protein L3V59_39400 [Burkholderia aenigmatica]
MSLDFLIPVQTLPTSGARTAAVFEIDGATYLGIPQLAVDIAGQPPHMNGGDSDIGAQFYRRDGGCFVEDGTLPLPGGEDLEYFEIGARRFLAAAGVRSGKGPYDLNTDALLHEWTDGAWCPFQRIPAFAAKQFRAFRIGTRHFLGLAQGVKIDGVTARHPRESCVLEWTGNRFDAFQTFDGQWGYDWISARFGGEYYLAYADHVDGATLYRWNGERFETFQALPGHGARTFRFFEDGGALWMVYVNIQDHTTLYRLDGQAFAPVQQLAGAGGRELCMIDGADGCRYLVRVCFITGTPHDPVVVQRSQVFAWRGDGFALLGEFPTSGATSASTFVADGARYLVVSNALSENIRFRVDSTVYRFER